MSAASVLDAIGALHDPASRGPAALRLAQHLGAEGLLLYIEDPAIGVLLPAPGFAQTVRGGPTWRSLLTQCRTPGRHQATVELEGRTQAASAISTGRIAAIALGGAPDPEALDCLQALLPLLFGMLEAERAAFLARGESIQARQNAASVMAMAHALETARADGARLNVELQAEQRRKDDFLAMLAHELRNPLAPLVTCVELLRRAGTAGTSETLAIMSRQIGQLTRLVEDLLDVSRVSRGLIELRREHLRVVDALKLALEVSEPILQTRGHHPRLHIADDRLVLHADRARIIQIFSNLLHNAAKYTDPGGRIDITLERDGQMAVVRVTDSGIGIDAEFLPHIFTLFTQAPVALDRSQGGLGVGLTLVRQLVALHGGEVTATSAGVGLGSSFTVRLPLSDAQSPSPEPVAGKRQRDALGPRRILVIDDNADAADTMVELIKLMGHHAHAALGGSIGLQVAATFDPDLVLLDIGLPDVNGYEVARRLRHQARPELRLIALTGYGSEKDREQALRAGFNEHAVKPLGPEELAAMIARARA